MSNEKIVVSRQSMDLLGVFFIVLFLLKLGVVETIVVGWSWWWITAPIWGPFALAVGIIIMIPVTTCFLALTITTVAAIAASPSYIISNIKAKRRTDKGRKKG